MKIFGEYKRFLTDEEGNVEVSFSIGNLYHIESIKQLIKGNKYELEIKEKKSKRSIEQNKLMWQLISDIDIAMNGKHTDIIEIYCMCLERASVKYIIIPAIEDVEDYLKKSFRGVRKLRCITIDGKLGYEFQCFIGSSRMNTKEMKDLIEIIMDIAEEVGVDTRKYTEV